MINFVEWNVIKKIKVYSDSQLIVYQVLGGISGQAQHDEISGHGEKVEINIWRIFYRKNT